jgi:hypothetical protein
MAYNIPINRNSLTNNLETRYKNSSHVSETPAQTNFIDVSNEFQNNFTLKQKPLTSLYTEKATNFASSDLKLDNTKYKP